MCFFESLPLPITRAQQRAERRAVRPGEEELKRDGEDCKWESGWSEEEVDGDDVHDDRREHSQRERHEAAGQERGPRDRIRPKKQREEVPAGDEPTHELRGGTLLCRVRTPAADTFQTIQKINFIVL